MKRFAPLTIAALAGCLATAIWLNEKHTFARVEAQTARYAQFIEPHLWNIDREDARQELEIISKAGGYRSIYVTHSDGEAFASIDKDKPSRGIEALLGKAGLIRDVPVGSPVLHDGMEIGRMDAEWTNKNIYTYFYILCLFILCCFVAVLAQFFRRAARQKGEAEKALTESRKRLQIVVSGAPIMLFSLTPQGVFTLCEGKGLEKLRRNQAEIIAHSVTDVFKDTPAMIEDFHRALAGETFTSTREIGRRVFECWYTPVHEANGRVARVTVVATDITELQRAMEELAKRDERLGQELLLARKIQRALVPAQLPRIPGLDLGLLFIPSGDIGGDFVDFIKSEGNTKLGVVCSDITGHGVPAALLSAIFKVLVGDILRSKQSPSACISSLNQRLCDEFPLGNFASTFYSVFDIQQRTLTYVKASQEPALLFRRGENVQYLQTGGPVLGILNPATCENVHYEQSTIPLQVGDTIFLYTDGLIELENAGGVMLERADLIRWIEQDLALSPQELVQRIHSRSVEFAGTSELPDDVTVVAIRVGMAA